MIKYTVMNFSDVRCFEKFSAVDENNCVRMYVKLPKYSETVHNEHRDRVIFNACKLYDLNSYSDLFNNSDYVTLDDFIECTVYGER